MLNIGIVESQEITRYALKALIREVYQGDINVLELDNLADLKSYLAKDPNAVIIVDPFSQCLEKQSDLLLMLREQNLKSQWLLFFSELNEQWLKQFLSNRISSFNIVFQNDKLEHIKEGISKTILKETYLAPWIKKKLEEHQDSILKVEQILTNAEREILKEIASGKMTKEIAAERSISTHTVITHRKNIFKKLGVSNVYDATRYAIRSGIITVNDYYI
ncbi:response regulator transcription factor [Myroides marinus]|jgi:DNA-binding NarL/FixJ family response regulator|uniref:DNA-binding response regulator, NarL/FixJ family, contains REC and HTH domains n=1 Tax=Myroides marinus TaxID=703342 RepID=A0A161SBH6_9FLAO|nr:response regulator transcription factor [Myroides marinus]MDR0195654.1 response regulator transcription factor [Myroides sp.]KUF45464.1 helix-turn-helix transcriptional regulator [Myroides marinus]KZE83109.1 helix-turn-helix transcriptional regulator [Myroides marinus]MDM1345474.1 response regulator transcription factor [Myroides marinus]MDM1349063.1 response regulator transcription factor [Myroides marinus]